MICYREFGAECMKDIIRIYESEGWDLYLSDADKVKRAFEKSLYCLGAFEGERLVGFIRCSGDGEYVVNVEDLIVERAYRRRHIGRELIEAVCVRFAHVDMVTLLTDMNDEAVNRFYRSAGFVEYGGKALVGYARQIRK